MPQVTTSVVKKKNDLRYSFNSPSSTKIRMDNTKKCNLFSKTHKGITISGIENT